MHSRSPENHHPSTCSSTPASTCTSTPASTCSSTSATTHTKLPRTIVMRCLPQHFGQWETALSFYRVVHSSPDAPLEQELLHAAENNASLFVIVDNPHTADDALIASLRAYVQTPNASQSSMRISFIASAERETPSAFFRTLANFDIYDLIVPPRDNVRDFNPYVEVARVLSQPQTYSNIVAYLTGEIINPKLSGLPSAELLKERSRAQVRIGVAQIDERRGGSTHTALLLARTLVLLGYKVAFFIEEFAWKNIRRCYPRARCVVENGVITLSGIDFYRNRGFMSANGYDYVIADFGCARWIDLSPDKQACALKENFRSASLAVLTSVVSPLGNHSSFERVLKIWQKKQELQTLGAVKFAFFGMPHDAVFENWQKAAKHLNNKAELYRIPYLPDPLHYEAEAGHCPELVAILSPVLRAKDRQELGGCL